VPVLNSRRFALAGRNNTVICGVLDHQKKNFWEKYQDDSIATYLAHNKHTYPSLAGFINSESII
jgi:hypothetical protein